MKEEDLETIESEIDRSEHPKVYKARNNGTQTVLAVPSWANGRHFVRRVSKTGIITFKEVEK